VADWTTPALPRPRLPSPAALHPPRRVATTAAVVIAVLALAYLAARFTPLFAVRDVEVIGAPARVHADVETALAPLEGTSLVGLDGKAVLRTVEALPTVVSARYDRAFPHTLRVFVAPERPVALAAHRGVRWVVSERGRVIGRAGHTERGAYPLIRTSAASDLAPGEIVRAPELVAPLRALALVSRSFPARVREARVSSGAVTLVLGGEIELRLGEPVDLPLKFAAAARVLSALGAEERARLAYLDATLPQRIVAADKSQPTG
jgi:cell division protein FtsQ